MAVNQKLISFKINVDLLCQLDAMCGQVHEKRNYLLNMFVKLGLMNLTTYQVTKFLYDNAPKELYDYWLDNR